jgi:chemotaxis protein MotB
MARRRSRALADDHGGGGGHGGASGRWLVSYADFITLLFVVFTVLFSMATVDAANYSKLATSLRQSLGPNVPPLPTRGMDGEVMPIVPPESSGTAPVGPDWTIRTMEESEGRAVIPPKEPPIEPPLKLPEEPPKQAPATGPGPKADSDTPKSPPAVPKAPPPDPMSDLTKVFQSLPGVRSGLLTVALQERGIAISIAGSVLFDPGKTAIKAEAQGHLDEVSGKLRGIEMPILVEGTADATPVGELSTWDLSALRAGSVVRYLVEQRGLPAGNFVTIGYGGNAEAAAKDRVTIVIMRREVRP